MKINKVNAVVTGGGSGLGEGTARYLKDKGANVFLIDINEENLKKVSSELDAEYFVGDVSDANLMSEAIGNLDDINCLVNCAGIAVGSKVVSSRGIHDLGLFEKVLKINLLGSFNLIRLCADKILDGGMHEICKFSSPSSIYSLFRHIVKIHLSFRIVLSRCSEYVQIRYSTVACMKFVNVRVHGVFTACFGTSSKSISASALC